MSLREMRQALALENQRWPAELVIVPVHLWPPPRVGARVPFCVWRSRKLLVQAFQEIDGVVRLSINRAAIDDDGRWKDGLSWDELQAIKRAIGYGDRFAVEAYPEDEHLVDVANMRHLWLLPERPAWAWKARG